MKLRKTILSTLILLVSLQISVRAQDSIAQKINYYQQKAARFLVKDSSLYQYFQIDTSGISIFASPQDKQQRQPEFKIYWDELDAFKSVADRLPDKNFADILHNKKERHYNAGQVKIINQLEKQPDFFAPDSMHPLNGLKIAIDPGHIGSDIAMAKLERKYVEMPPDTAAGIRDSIQLEEGNETFATALFLKKHLEQDGATVMITRKKPGLTAFGITYDQWLHKNLRHAVDSAFQAGGIDAAQKKYFLQKEPRETIFHVLYNDIDMRKRADMINAFHPNLTIIIHYNVDEKNKGWNKPSDKDYVMTFVGGSFEKGELDRPEKRVQFLRLLITDDIPRSMVLCKSAVNLFSHILQVPIADSTDATYLTTSSLNTGAKGVFARNLYLTRAVHGPLVYGETLYQDNVRECQLLNKKYVSIEGMKTSERVKQVADAYYLAVLDYEKKLNKK